MIAFTTSIILVLLVTSQYIDAYPSASVIGTKINHPLNPRLKRDFGFLQRHESTNNINDDTPINWDDNLPYIYSIIPRTNHKRLIDF
jgi:hypothetical protein